MLWIQCFYVLISRGNFRLPFLRVFFKKRRFLSHFDGCRDVGMECDVCRITQQRKHLESSGFHWKIAHLREMCTSYFWIHENLIKLTKFSKWRTKVQDENYLNQVLLENYKEFHKTLFPGNVDLVETLPDMCHLSQKTGPGLPFLGPTYDDPNEKRERCIIYASQGEKNCSWDSPGPFPTMTWARDPPWDRHMTILLEIGYGGMSEGWCVLESQRTHRHRTFPTMISAREPPGTDIWRSWKFRPLLEQGYDVIS